MPFDKKTNNGKAIGDRGVWEMLGISGELEGSLHYAEDLFSAKVSESIPDRGDSM